MHCDKIFVKCSAMITVWFCHTFFSDVWLLTNRIFTRFRTFSIVLPKTLLFMSLKKSFSNSFCALEWRFVFNSIYGFNHAFSSKEIPRWIFVSFKPRSKYCFKFLWWRTYFFFSFRLGISFSTLLISIRSGARWYSLCKSLSFFEYSKSTSRIHPLPCLFRKFSPIFQICHPLEACVKENLCSIGTKFPLLGTTVKSLHGFDSWMYQGRYSQVKARLISLKLLDG